MAAAVATAAPAALPPAATAVAVAVAVVAGAAADGAATASRGNAAIPAELQASEPERSIFPVVSVTCTLLSGRIVTTPEPGTDGTYSRSRAQIARGSRRAS